MKHALHHRLFGLLPVVALLAACGGGGGPLGNPPLVDNPTDTGGRTLSFAYFQRCIQPIFVAELPIKLGSTTSVNTCASGGCHDNTTGTAGPLRIRAAALPVDLSDAAANAATIRTSEMYKNYLSAQGSTSPGSPSQSLLLAKPLLLKVLHGGGLIFENQNHPLAQRIAYWISHPAPAGQDEFASADTMFTPADAATGACNPP